MPYREVKEPVNIKEAFRRRDDSAILSQAAILLILGSRLRGDPVTQTSTVATLEARSNQEDDDLAALGVPHLRPTFGRVDASRVRSALQFQSKLLRLSASAKPVRVPPAILHKLANRLVDAPEDVAAANLMEASLNHPHELVRVASAVAYFDRSSEPARLLDILRRGANSKDLLVRDVAATALGHIAPDENVLARLKEAGPRARGIRRPTHTTVIVHGTWAANSPWWQPNGNFFNFLTTTLPPLPRTAPFPPPPSWDAPFGAAGYFGWTGGYSDAARAQGAQDLIQWVAGHSAAGLDLITHSHGGNLAFLASQSGLQSSEIVALSCPVHFPKYAPNFSNVKKIVSVRVHLDLVILADRGGQRFNDPRIRENVLPVWFDHFATHDPNVWTKHDVAAML
jgi:hypothetical protein